MHRSIFQILFFILIIAVLSNCSETPKQPDDISKIEIDKKITDPAQIRQLQAKQRLASALAKKQPEKNKLLLKLIDFLFQPITELNLPSENEYALIIEILAEIDSSHFNKEQHNHYLLSQIKILLSQQQYQKAELLLGEFYDNNLLTGLNHLPIKQQIEYHDIRATIYTQKQKNISAAKELITAFLLEKQLPSQKSEQYLLRIWDIISHFQLYQLEKQVQNLVDNTDNTDSQELQMQLNGWLRLMIQVKKHAQRFRLNKQITAWSETFPLHMANQYFIQQQLKQRFELLANPKQVALLLPNTGRLSKVAQVIINGFLAAHFQSPINNQLIIRIYDSTAFSSIWPSYKKAIDDGAEVIIGPFEKKYIRELSTTDSLPVTTLALNNIALTNSDKNETNNNNEELNYKLTEKLYQFALNPEDEITIITHRARQQGFNNAAFVTPDTKWGKRLKAIYENKWRQLGGIIVSSQEYDPKNYDYSSSIKHLLKLDESNQRRAKVRQTIGKGVEYTPRIRNDIDVIFLAAFPQQGKQIPLQISYHHGANIPVYATSHIVGKAFNKKENSDLNGITYTDMPWLIDKKIPAISRSSKQKTAAYQRLFSFGVDSYKIIPFLALMASNSSEQFAGETGLLQLSKRGYIKRKIPTARIKNGQAIVNHD